MNCVEKGRLHLSGGSYVQGNEGAPHPVAMRACIGPCCCAAARCACSGAMLKLPYAAWAWLLAHRRAAGPCRAGSLEFNAGVRNALGRAERLDVAAEWGSKGSNEYSVAVSQPRVGGRPVTVEARVAQLFRNFLRHSSFTEQLRQTAVTVSTCVHLLQSADAKASKLCKQGN